MKLWEYSEKAARQIASVMTQGIRECVSNFRYTAAWYYEPIALAKRPMLPHHKLPVSSIPKLLVVFPRVLWVCQSQDIISILPGKPQNTCIQYILHHVW